jgi:uncharacterized metal-binding protein YceD (DUF177 family)
VKEGALFSIPLADLDYGDREIDEEIPLAWLTQALEGTEATVRGDPGRLVVTVSKNGREVMVRGKARAYVTMPCARTLDPVNFDLEPDIFLLLAPPGQGVPRPAPKAQQGQPPKTQQGQPPKTQQGQSPKAQLGQAKKPERKPTGGRERRKKEEEALLAEEEAAHDTYEADRVTLDRFIREFLVLELPMVPLREDLRSEATPAIERPPEPANEGRPTGEAIDPRLAPLAAIASRLRAKKE